MADKLVKLFEFSEAGFNVKTETFNQIFDSLKGDELFSFIGLACTEKTALEFFQALYLEEEQSKLSEHCIRDNTGLLLFPKIYESKLSLPLRYMFLYLCTDDEGSHAYFEDRVSCLSKTCSRILEFRETGEREIFREYFKVLSQAVPDKNNSNVCKSLLEFTPMDTKCRPPKYSVQHQKIHNLGYLTNSKENDSGNTENPNETKLINKSWKDVQAIAIENLSLTYTPHPTELVVSNVIAFLSSVANVNKHNDKQQITFTDTSFNEFNSAYRSQFEEKIKLWISEELHRDERSPLVDVHSNYTKEILNPINGLPANEFEKQLASDEDMVELEKIMRDYITDIYNFIKKSTRLNPSEIQEAGRNFNMKSGDLFKDNALYFAEIACKTIAHIYPQRCKKVISYENKMSEEVTTFQNKIFGFVESQLIPKMPLSPEIIPNIWTAHIISLREHKSDFWNQESTINRFAEGYEILLKNNNEVICKLQKEINRIIGKLRLQYTSNIEKFLASNTKGIATNELQDKHIQISSKIKQSLIAELHSKVSPVEPYEGHWKCLNTHIERYFTCIQKANSENLQNSIDSYQMKSQTGNALLVSLTMTELTIALPNAESEKVPLATKVAVYNDGKISFGSEVDPESCINVWSLNKCYNRREPLPWPQKFFFYEKEYQFSTELLIALLLIKAKRVFESVAKVHFNNVLIAVPHEFTFLERSEVYDAAVCAGFSEVFVVNELSVAVYGHLLNTDTKQKTPGSYLVMSHHKAKIYSAFYNFNKEDKRLILSKDEYQTRASDNESSNLKTKILNILKRLFPDSFTDKKANAKELLTASFSHHKSDDTGKLKTTADPDVTEITPSLILSGLSKLSAVQKNDINYIFIDQSNFMMKMEFNDKVETLAKPYDCNAIEMDEIQLTENKNIVFSRIWLDSKQDDTIGQLNINKLPSNYADVKLKPVFLVRCDGRVLLDESKTCTISKQKAGGTECNWGINPEIIKWTPSDSNSSIIRYVQNFISQTGRVQELISLQTKMDWIKSKIHSGEFTFKRETGKQVLIQRLEELFEGCKNATIDVAVVKSELEKIENRFSQ